MFARRGDLKRPLGRKLSPYLLKGMGAGEGVSMACRCFRAGKGLFPSDKPGKLGQVGRHPYVETLDESCLGLVVYRDHSPLMP